MVDPGFPRSPWLVAEALGTGTVLADMDAILAAHSRTVCRDGLARTPEERTGRGLHSFLSHIVLGEVPVPILECVKLVGVNKDGRVNLMHSIFSVRIDVYSTECCLFACLGELPSKGLPPVMEIPPAFFAAWRSIRSVPRSDHIACLGGISLLDWQTNPCERAVIPDHINLACRGMVFFPSDCAAWLLRREAGGPVNVFKASTGLFPILTG